MEQSIILSDWRSALPKKRKPFKQENTNQNESCMKMEKTDKPLTRDSIVAMQVIDQKGRLVGKVKDMALAVGKSGISLKVENEAGEMQTISWDDVQAASDFILLKPVPAPAVSAVSAPTVSEQEKVIEPKEQMQEKTSEPEIKKQSTKPLCPTCGQPLTWIPKYKRWYCYNDKKYV